MKIRKTLMPLLALSLLTVSLSASAQTDLTCDDIVFSAEVTAKYPSVAAGCRDVVELNDERYAQTTVELLRTRMNGATFRFKHADGSYGPTESADLDPSWRANIGGNSYRIRDLSRGQELNVYIPADRWEAHVARDTSSHITVYYAVAMLGDTGGGAALPTTASSMPLLGLLGGVALFAAFLMRAFRRRLTL